MSPKGFIPDSTLWDRDAIVRRLDAGRHEIVVQVLTYAPVSGNKKDDALDQALRRAAARGVKIKLLVSDWETSGSAIGYLQSLARVPNIEAKLTTVPEWSGGYIPFARVEHCKYMVVDSLWTWIGTSNWEPGYFHDSRNVAVTLRNQPIALQARKVFEASWSSPDAAPVKPDFTYAPKVHGATPPAGKQAYGK
jgi:phosphatidylserine/phosphatidylglycerophosphate/cardiolipin synthase-like enzyme